MGATTLDIRKPVEEVLLDLKKYYTEKKYHTEQLDYTDTFFNKKHEYTPIYKKTVFDENNSKENFKKADNLINFTKTWFLQKNTSKFINEFPQQEKFTTPELSVKVLGDEDFEKEFIGKVIYAISLSLGNLKKKGEIKADKEDCKAL